MWQDEKLAPLPPITRLVFIGLISMADDGGRIIDSARAVDGFIFPLTDDSSRESIEILVGLGLLSRGATSSGQRVIQIVNWSHQKIDRPNLSSALPPIVVAGESSKRRRTAKKAAGTARRKIAETSSKDRRDLDEGSSTNHRPISTTSTNDLRSTINDQLPTTDGAEVERDSVVRLVVAANLGIAQHEDPKRRQIDPINSGSLASKDATQKILAAGVPVEFAEAAITRIARVCEPNGRVNSLRYFTAAVVREWEERDGPIAKRPRMASRFAPASDTTKAIIADMIAGKS